MSLPLRRTYAPMEAQLVGELPVGPGWQYEPKWDGFRCLAFKDDDRVDVMSKAGKPLARYFPDVVELLRQIDAPRFVLDGEIVIPFDGSLSFDELLLRIHPAKSRVEKLSREHPAALVAFDLLVDADGASLIKLPLAERRSRLEAFVAAHVAPGARVWLSPATTEMKTVRRWFRSVGGGLDGVVAKRLGLPYLPGSREGVVKVKRHKTADCVIVGFRWSDKADGRISTLLLGLYDDRGELDFVGHCSGFPAAVRRELESTLPGMLEPGHLSEKRIPGGQSRWSRGKELDWNPVRPELVCEVRYDKLEGNRFRHGTRFLRFRPDKDPDQCTWDQVRPRRRRGDPTVQSLLSGARD